MGINHAKSLPARLCHQEAAIIGAQIDRAGKKRIQHISMYLKIKDQKIWVEEDNTDLGLVDALLAADIPKSDIILGFQHPSKRTLTEFAVA